MSELNFPKNPAVGQEYTFNSLLYMFDGVKWVTKGTGYNPVQDLYEMLASDAGASFVGVNGYDNVQAALDANADFVSRFDREALRRSYAEAGFNLVTGSFELGGTVTTDTDVLLYEAEGKAYSWGGTLSKDVSEGSTPSSSGGINAGAWADRSAAPNAFKQAGSGSALRVAQDKMRERVTPQDFGAVGDGITNDQAAFTALETSFTNQSVDLQGKTYLVDTFPLNNKYSNGFFKIGSTVYVAPTGFTRYTNDNAAILMGKDTGQDLPPTYKMPPNDFTYNNYLVGIGAGCMANLASGKQSIAIGGDAIGNGTISFDNIGIGEVSLQNVQSQTDSYSTTLNQGTRNVAIGGNSSQFLTTARGTVAIGRNAGTGNVSASGLVAMGNGALGGYAVSGWDMSITNFMPNNSNGDVAVVGVGYSAGATYQSTNLVAVGRLAAGNAKFSTGLTCLGSSAGASVESGTAFNGKVKTTTDGSNQSYTQTGNLINVVCPAHSAVVGGYAGLRLVTGGARYPHFHEFPVQVTAIIDANTYQVTSPYSKTASGQANTYWFSTLANGPRFTNGEFIGNNCGASMVSGQQGTFLGTACAQTMNDANSVVGIGYAALNAVPSAVATVAVGTGAFQTATTSYTNSTAIGHQAGMQMQDASTPTALSNVTCLGYRAYVSGSNQVQIGNSATTTYVYGTVQNRSDARDKTDIRDTQLGIDFIMGLRPVDGRWDLRDDYVENYEELVSTDEDGNSVYETKTRHLPKDGSKKRTRKHHWFIAQEVKELCDNLGVEFGGYQDHSLNGGCDVLSLGYDEFIPPLTKAVQDCWNEIESIKARLDAAGL